MGNFKGKDILHGNQLSKKDIETIIRISSNFEREHKKKKFSDSPEGNLNVGMLAIAMLLWKKGCQNEFLTSVNNSWYVCSHLD